MQFRSVAYEDGLPAAASWIRDGILAAKSTAPGRVKTAKSNGRPAAKSKARSAVRKKTAAKPGRRSGSSTRRK